MNPTVSASAYVGELWCVMACESLNQRPDQVECVAVCTMRSAALELAQAMFVKRGYVWVQRVPSFSQVVAYAGC